MASISSIPTTHFHVRSVSLPSRSSQISEFDDLEATTSCFDNLLKQVQNDDVNELIDGLLRLLELCSTAKDALLSTRDSAQELQSALRRKRGDSIAVSCAIQEYQSKRKAIKKAIVKAMRQLTGSSNKKIQESPLKEMESITLKVLESSLCLILGSSSQKNSNKWSLVTKILSPKQVASKESSAESHIRKELAEIESSFKDLQEGLECIYRHLIKTRVSLLNLLNC